MRDRRPAVARRAVARGAALRRPAARRRRRRHPGRPAARARCGAGDRDAGVGPLASDRALELLQAGRDHPVADLVASRVLATAGGNPLALLEIPALLGRDELEGRAPVEGPAAARLDARARARPPARRAREDTRRALLVAAAAEARRGDVVLGALAEAGLDVSALESAESAGIVTLAPGEVAFRHPLLRAAAYHGATAVARRDAHRAVARALPEDDPQRAWQLAAGATRPNEEIAAALEAAARSARARTGFGPAAHAHLRAAELSPEPLDRARRLVEAARDLLPAGHPDVGLARLEQAERVLAIAEGSDVSAVATELRTLRAQLALRTGRTEEARELLRAQARRLQDEAPPAAAMLLLLSSLGAMALRDHRGWLADAERARELAGDVELLAALAMLSAGAARWRCRTSATGRRLLEEGERRLGDLGLALSLAPEVVALAAHGWLWIEEYERGVEMLDRLVAAGRESSSVGALPYPLAARAQGNLSLGRYDRALADAEEAVALAEQTGQDPALVIALGMLATVHGWHGDETDAVEAAERAIELGERRNVPLPAIYARHALGLLASRPAAPRRRSSGSRRSATRRCPATSCGRRTWSTRTCAPAAATTPPRSSSTTPARSTPPDRARDPRAPARHDHARTSPTSAPRSSCRGRAGAVRARPHAARLRRVPARRGPPRGGARAAARRARRLRADRRAALRRARPPRAARGRRRHARRRPDATPS